MVPPIRCLRRSACWPRMADTLTDADADADIVTRALAEDLGGGDVTTEATVPADARAEAGISQKAPGVIFGLDVAEATFRALDPDATIERHVAEGVWRQSGSVLTVAGRARALLSAERTALNFLARLSGVATMAARAVRAVEGTGATILDTRKTTPGLRALEKAAVAAGGATHHPARSPVRRDPHQGEPRRARRRGRRGGAPGARGGTGSAAGGRMPRPHRG